MKIKMPATVLTDNKSSEEWGTEVNMFFFNCFPYI